MAITLTTTYVEDVAVLAVKGRLTLGEQSSALKDATRELIRQGHPKIICVIDDVSYIDSSGLDALVKSWVWASNAAGTLILVGLTKRTKDLLQITKLYTVFRVCETLDEALQSLGVQPRGEGTAI